MVHVYLIHREKERVEGQRATKRLQTTPPLPVKQQQQGTEQKYLQEKIEAKVYMHNLKVRTVCGSEVFSCMQNKYICAYLYF